jgi:hypothetical protein
MTFNERVQELHTYIDKWKEEVIKEFGLPAGNATTGLSFLPPSVVIPPGPQELVPALGFYKDPNGNVVEVDAADRHAVSFAYVGQVHSAVSGSELVGGSMNTQMFNYYFKSHAPEALVTVPELGVYVDKCGNEAVVSKADKYSVDFEYTPHLEKPDDLGHSSSGYMSTSYWNERFTRKP